MISRSLPPAASIIRDPIALFILALAVIYVAFAWTPSSYGLALAMMGWPGEGLVLGSPRPIRSDEWMVWTPYIQIAVNNGFERLNITSPYGEDLRNFNGLPILDWAIIFKPQFWLFFITDPARAFSFSHAIFIVLFLIGYSRLFEQFQFSRWHSWLSSVVLFFTSYAQFWWTTTGPLLAIFPWLIIICLSKTNSFFKAGAMAFTVTFWLLAHTYPPIVLSLSFSGAILLLALRPDVMLPRNIVPSVFGALGGLALVYIYLAEPLEVMAQTVYPGHRESSGGGVFLSIWLSQFFPFLVIDRTDSLVGLNLCEVSAGGSLLTLLSIVFVDHKILLTTLASDTPSAQRHRKTIALLFSGFALFSLWMLVPVPAYIGKFLLWNKIPPIRMVFASGLLLLALNLSILRLAPVRLTFPRFLIATIIIVSGWMVSKYLMANAPLHRSWLDVLILLPLAGAVAMRNRIGRHTSLALIACAALANIAGFGWFNPIQSAKPIFERSETLVTKGFEALAARHPKGWLVTEGFPGALLNGWGFRSVSHVLIAPQQAFFRSFFPQFDASTFNNVFNRYAHVQLSHQRMPEVPQADVIRVPITAFHPNQQSQRTVTPDSGLTGRFPQGGHIDEMIVGKQVVIRGWGFFAGSHDGRILIRTRTPVVRAQAATLPRPDVVTALGDRRLALAGFEVTLELEAPIQAHDICVVTEDPELGSFLLSGKSVSEACQDLVR